MSTEFHIRRAKPILCFPEFPIGTRTAYGACLDANLEKWDHFIFETERPVFHDLDGIRPYIESGEWEIVDERDREYTFEEFEGLMSKRETDA